MPLRSRKKSLPSLCLTFPLIFLAAVIFFVSKKEKGAEADVGQFLSRSETKNKFNIQNVCPITSISSLSDKELQPVAGDRHMVTPPKGGKLHLVCCDTTKGKFNLLLHQNWAPLGVPHFLEMIDAGYFRTSRIPLFRCTDACQFGLAGDANMTKRFRRLAIQDDPQWLPGGREHQKNEKGVRRYPKGYFTYAGGGPNSRSNQFVITLKPNLFMGGGSPWEVPAGELVGEHSFETISKWYNGYGEKGPSQGLLSREGVTEKIMTGWPLMDYIDGCSLTDEMELPNPY